MAETKQGAALQEVTCNQLQPGMVIREITELSFDYATLDTKSANFLKTNFKGASAVISGDSGVKEVPMEQVQEFDQVQAIVGIPESLKLAKVVAGLPASLEKHGFLQFKVTVSEDVPVSPVDEEKGAPAVQVGSAEAKTLHAQKVVEVRKFLDMIEPANEQREKASTAIEDMMDRGRAGQFNSQGAEDVVQEILKQGTGSAMQAVAGLRGSDQTYAHCVDMSSIMQGCYADILKKLGKKVDEPVNRFTLVCGFVHDIGKSQVPKDVLESTVRFAPDSQEMLILRNHTTYGAKILEDMGMHKTTINVAHYHHVKKDPSLFTSYPDVSYDQVNPLTRFASIVDVYQALIGKRNYKRNWVPGKAIEYILGLKESEFDGPLVDHFVESMGRYPVGSLVKLNTGELAFVLMIAPKEYPERPIVAVVENKAGELLSQHTILDLMLESDIQVAEIVDHYEHFSESEDQAYKIFQSIRVA